MTEVNTVDSNVTDQEQQHASIADNAIIKLTAMELNSIKLDDKHTLLTPDYMESLVAKN